MALHLLVKGIHGDETTGSPSWSIPVRLVHYCFERGCPYFGKMHSRGSMYVYIHGDETTGCLPLKLRYLPLKARKLGSEIPFKSFQHCVGSFFIQELLWVLNCAEAKFKVFDLEFPGAHFFDENLRRE